MPHAFFYYLWLAFMAFGFLAWFFSHKGKQEERKMLIQQGADIETLLKKDKKGPSWILKTGIVLIGLGLGLAIITILINLNLIGHSDAIYPAIICICTGISLVVAHRIGKRGNED